jgi:hypothetical protein
LFFLVYAGWLAAQSLIPNPWTFASCVTAVSPVGWISCTGTPDCAASRCVVPAGCSGAAVMCFGESFRYVLPAPLTIGQQYTITMNVSTGQLGAATIIGGSHTFNVIGLTSAPTNCGAANYGSACSTPGSTLLLSGTVNTIGWQTFTNTFTAASALQHIVIGNCDNTGNGGNLFCNFTLTPAVVLPVEIGEFTAQALGCAVDLQWRMDNPGNVLEEFELVRSVEGMADAVVATVPADVNRTDYLLTDGSPSLNCDYQLRVRYRDGTITQSPVVHVQADCDEMHNAFENNPVRDEEAILRYRSNGKAMSVTLRNMEGRVVLQTAMEAGEAGWQRVRLDVRTLQPGIYFASTGDGQVTRLQLLR